MLRMQKPLYSDCVMASTNILTVEVPETMTVADPEFPSRDRGAGVANRAESPGEVPGAADADGR